MDSTNKLARVGPYTPAAASQGIADPHDLKTEAVAALTVAGCIRPEAAFMALKEVASAQLWALTRAHRDEPEVLGQHLRQMCYAHKIPSPAQIIQHWLQTDFGDSPADNERLHTLWPASGNTTHASDAETEGPKETSPLSSAAVQRAATQSTVPCPEPLDHREDSGEKARAAGIGAASQSQQQSNPDMQSATRKSTKREREANTVVELAAPAGQDSSEPARPSGATVEQRAQGASTCRRVVGSQLPHHSCMDWSSSLLAPGFACGSLSAGRI